MEERREKGGKLYDKRIESIERRGKATLEAV